MSKIRRGKYPKLKRKMSGPIGQRPEFCEVPGCERKAAAMDHCHDTGRFRGWLCKSCNTSLGVFGDTAASLRRSALVYLEMVEALPPVEVWTPKTVETSAERLQRIRLPKIDLSVFELVAK